MPEKRILVVCFPSDAPYTISRDKTPIVKDGEIVGYERGKITIELPADTDLQFFL